MGSMNFASASPLAKRKTTNRLIAADHPPLISGSVEEAHEPKALRTNDLGRDYPPIKHLISGSVDKTRSRIEPPPQQRTVAITTENSKSEIAARDGTLGV